MLSLFSDIIQQVPPTHFEILQSLASLTCQVEGGRNGDKSPNDQAREQDKSNPPDRKRQKKECCSPNALLCSESLSSYNPTFLSSFMNLFDSCFPIVHRPELCFAIDEVETGESTVQNSSPLNVEHRSACIACLWACLSIGAFFQGNNTAAKHLGFLANESLASCQHTSLQPSVARAEILIYLMSSCMGDEFLAAEHVSRAERLILLFPDFRGTIKALHLLLLPESHVYENIELYVFHTSDLHCFSEECKLYYRWKWLFLAHLKQHRGNLWNKGPECYANLLKVATSLENKVDNFFIIWQDLQTMLIKLEIEHFGFADKGIQRAEELTQFLLKNKSIFFPLARIAPRCVSMLELLAAVFYIKRDSIYLKMVEEMWTGTVDGKAFPQHSDFSWKTQSLKMAPLESSSRIQQTPRFSESFVNPSGRFEDDAVSDFLAFTKEDKADKCNTPLLNSSYFQTMKGRAASVTKENDYSPSF